MVVFFSAVLLGVQAAPHYDKEDLLSDFLFYPTPLSTTFQNRILLRQQPTIIGDSQSSSQPSPLPQPSPSPLSPNQVLQALAPALPVLNKAFEILLKSLSAIMPTLVNSAQSIQSGGTVATAAPQAVYSAANQLNPILSEVAETLGPTLPFLSNTLSVVSQQLPQLASAFQALGRRQAPLNSSFISEEITGTPVFERTSAIIDEEFPVFQENALPVAMTALPYINDGAQSNNRKPLLTPYIVNSYLPYSPYLQQLSRYIVV